MKTIRQLTMRFLAVAVMAVAFILPSNAQSLDKLYANIDWQFNSPINNSFAEKISGWGMNLEGGYYLSENFSVGAFLAYHSNHKYIPRETISLSGNSAINTDQQHTLFQMPFGVSGRYTFNKGGFFQPYFSMKAGPQYGRMKTVLNASQVTDNTWGFYVSPEIGANIFPWVYQPGIHIAAYYSYATTKGSVMNYSVDNMSNFGIRVGIAF